MNCNKNKQDMMKPSRILLVLVTLLIASFPLAQAAQGNDEPISVKVLATYRKDDQTWKYLLIPHKLTRERLIKLARELHRAEPDTSFGLFDDDKQFQQFMAWNKNYPSAAYPYPEKWVEKHYIAMINKMGGEWQLVAMYASLEFAETPYTQKIISLE